MRSKNRCRSAPARSHPPSRWYTHHPFLSLCHPVGIITVGFFNYHITYYDNYAHMLFKLAKLTWERYVLPWPPRVMPLLSLVPLLACVRLVIKAWGDTVDAKAPQKAHRAGCRGRGPAARSPAAGPSDNVPST